MTFDAALLYGAATRIDAAGEIGDGVAAGMALEVDTGVDGVDA